MILKTDLHMHTNFCDGADTPEQMVLSGIEKGLKTIGIVVHSYTHFLPKYCCMPDQESVFISEMHRLKDKYADKINVLCGIEADYLSDKSQNKFDYVIGSVHYVKINGKYYPIDHSKEIFTGWVKEVFNGDYYRAVKEYFALEENVVEKTGADIIGHFDLIRKFNANENLFSESDERYLEYSTRALDGLIKTKKPFEINTGAISRGYTDKPYPKMNAYQYIKERGGKFVISSDSHSAKNIAYQFEKWGKEYSLSE